MDLSDLTSDRLMDSDDENEVVKGEIFELQSAIKQGKANQKYPANDNDVNKERNPHETPQKEILWAARKGRLHIIKTLLDSDPSLVNVNDNDGYTPLHRACYSNHPDVVQILLAHGADVGARTADLWTPLHSASKWNSIQCAVQLLQHGADVNSTTDSGQTPLHLAATHPETKDLLLLYLSHPAIKVDLQNKNGESAKDLAHRSCKYYKLFEITDKSVNLI